MFCECGKRGIRLNKHFYYASEVKAQMFIRIASSDFYAFTQVIHKLPFDFRIYLKKPQRKKRI